MSCLDDCVLPPTGVIAWVVVQFVSTLVLLSSYATSMATRQFPPAISHLSNFSIAFSALAMQMLLFVRIIAPNTYCGVFSGVLIMSQGLFFASYVGKLIGSLHHIYTTLHQQERGDKWARWQMLTRKEVQWSVWAVLVLVHFAIGAKDLGAGNDDLLCGSPYAGSVVTAVFLSYLFTYLGLSITVMVHGKHDLAGSTEAVINSLILVGLVSVAVGWANTHPNEAFLTGSDVAYNVLAAFLFFAPFFSLVVPLAMSVSIPGMPSSIPHIRLNSTVEEYGEDDSDIVIETGPRSFTTAPGLLISLTPGDAEQYRSQMPDTIMLERVRQYLALNRMPEDPADLASAPVMRVDLTPKNIEIALAVLCSSELAKMKIGPLLYLYAAGLRVLYNNGATVADILANIKWPLCSTLLTSFYKGRLAASAKQSPEAIRNEAAGLLRQVHHILCGFFDRQA
jgi:hypothetical protein